MPRFLLAALAVVLTSSASAQPLVTDRPDFTESPSAVEPGRFQIEGGATVSVFRDAGENLIEFVAPEALVRVGLLPGLEGRVTTPDYVRAIFGRAGEDVVVDGAGDPTVGLKAEIGRFGGTDVGIIAQASIPLGDDEFGNDRVIPGAILTAGGDITETISAGAQVETVYYGDGNGPFGGSLTVGGTVVVGLAVDEQVGVFAELVLEDVVEGVTNPYALVHTGATLLLSPDAQLDAHAGIGLAGYGLEIVDRVPIEVTPGLHNADYLRTKRDRMGHEILAGADEHDRQVLKKVL